MAQMPARIFHQTGPQLGWKLSIYWMRDLPCQIQSVPSAYTGADAQCAIVHPRFAPRVPLLAWREMRKLFRNLRIATPHPGEISGLG
jgi:hypothetical protein